VCVCVCELRVLCVFVSTNLRGKKRTRVGENEKKNSDVVSRWNGAWIEDR
jgi:hypothetical protein